MEAAMLMKGALVAAAAASGGGAGLCAWMACHRHAQRARLVRRARGTEDAQGAGAPKLAEGSLDERVIAYAQSLSHRLALKGAHSRVPRALSGVAAFEKGAATAGLQGTVSADGFAEARLRLALGAAAAGAVVGAVFSFELMALLAVTGAVAGWQALPRAVRKRRARRTLEMERHLPEMIDVVAMGMRSGLSFDRSLGLYVQYFPTMLAEAFGAAQRQWAHGLMRRDDALRALAKTYDSPVFGRVIESIVRSLRFGSSLAVSLETLAAEARASYRAQRQEQVAKAPIKIMVPTGTLILPAMLILVLGPVLLELMGDF